MLLLENIPLSDIVIFTNGTGYINFDVLIHWQKHSEVIYETEYRSSL